MGLEEVRDPGARSIYQRGHLDSISYQRWTSTVACWESPREVGPSMVLRHCKPRAFQRVISTPKGICSAHPYRATWKALVVTYQGTTYQGFVVLLRVKMIHGRHPRLAHSQDDHRLRPELSAVTLPGQISSARCSSCKAHAAGCMQARRKPEYGTNLRFHLGIRGANG